MVNIIVIPPRSTEACMPGALTHLPTRNDQQWQRLRLPFQPARCSHCVRSGSASAHTAAAAATHHISLRAIVAVLHCSQEARLACVRLMKRALRPWLRVPVTESQASVSTRVSPVELAGCIPAGHITVSMALLCDGCHAHRSGSCELVLSTRVPGDFLPTAVGVALRATLTCMPLPPPALVQLKATYAAPPC